MLDVIIGVIIYVCLIVLASYGGYRISKVIIKKIKDKKKNKGGIN